MEILGLIASILGILAFFAIDPNNMVKNFSAWLFISKRKQKNNSKEFIKFFQEFDVIQMGWDNLIFGEHSIEILIYGKFKIDKEIESKIKNKYQTYWESVNFQNNQQIGIIEIDPHRLTDNVTEGQSHVLKIKAHIIDYFDFLSTNRILKFGDDKDKEIIKRFIDEPIYPIKEFANPLSVGLTLFCERGKCLVLTKRSNLHSSGGGWESGLYFNAVGETIAPIDICECVLGHHKISVQLAAKRGLQEEIGINMSTNNIIIHSFIRDKRILDYKFFGYVISELNREDIELFWNRAPDKSESLKLVFYDLKKPNDSELIINNILNHSTEWSKEASYSTVMALMVNKNISEDKVYELFSTHNP